VNAERELVTDDEIAERIADDERLRQRLRNVVLLVVPNKWGLRGTLFRVIDHAPPSRVLALRDSIRELVK
jgi:hypothetical protein